MTTTIYTKEHNANATHGYVPRLCDGYCCEEHHPDTLMQWGDSLMCVDCIKEATAYEIKKASGWTPQFIRTCGICCCSKQRKRFKTLNCCHKTICKRCIKKVRGTCPYCRADI